MVPQAYALQVKAGMAVGVSQAELPGQEFAGTVARTGQALDAASRSLQTEILVPNEDGRLLAGAYVTVRLRLVQAPVLEAPANTLLLRAEGPHIAVVGKEGRVHLQPVVLGTDFGKTVQVLSGISRDDALILNPADGLADGDQVVPAAPAHADGQARHAAP
jgi:multidrug efflux pump subunit AcrA (membrane-fusion protein)